MNHWVRRFLLSLSCDKKIKTRILLGFWLVFVFGLVKCALHLFKRRLENGITLGGGFDGVVEAFVRGFDILEFLLQILALSLARFVVCL